MTELLLDPGPQPGPSPADFIMGQRRSSTGLALNALGDNPDDAARAGELSRATGVPDVVINGDLDNFESQHRATLTGQIFNANPHLRNYVANNPIAASASNDDWGVLDKISHSLGWATDGNESILQKIMNGGLSPNLWEHTATGQAIKQSIQQGFMQGFGPGGLGSWMESLPERDKELFRQHRMAMAEWQVLGAPPELFFRGMGGVINAAVQGVAETYAQATGDREGAQKYGEQAVQAISDPGLQASLMGIPEVGPLLSGALRLTTARMAMRVKPFIHAGVEPPRGIDPIIDHVHAAQSQMDVDNLFQTLQEVQKSATKERDSDLMAKFIREHSPAEIGITNDAVRRLYGDSVPMPDDGLLGWVPGIEDQLVGSDATGGDIRVPLADWLAKMDPKVAKDLKEDIRVRPNGMTLAETKDLKPIDMDEDLFEAKQPDAPQTLQEELQARFEDKPAVIRGDEPLELANSIRDSGGLHPIGEQVKLKKVSQGDGRFANVHDFDLLDGEGKRVGDIQLTYDEAKQDLHVEYVRHDEGPGAFGPRAVRDLARQLKAEFPEAKTISGIRVSGAREKALQDQVRARAKTATPVSYDEWRRLTGHDDTPEAKYEYDHTSHYNEHVDSWDKVSVPLSRSGELIGDLAERRGRVTEDGKYITSEGLTYQPIEEGKLTPEHRQAIDRVNAVFDKMAPRLVERRAVMRIKTPTGGQAGGTYANFKSRMPLIIYALEHGDVIGSARHEIIHHLRRTGFLSNEEWVTLRDAAVKGNWISKYNIAKRYKGTSLANMLEESVAEHFAHWYREEYKPGDDLYQGPKTGLGIIFQRMGRLFEGIRTAVRGALGKDADWRDLFTKIESGEVGSRRGVKPLDEREYRGPTYSKEGEDPIQGLRDIAEKTTQEGIKKHIEAQRPKDFWAYMQQRTKNLSRVELLEGDQLWTKAKELSDKGKYSFEQAFKYMAERVLHNRGDHEALTGDELAEMRIGLEYNKRHAGWKDHPERKIDDDDDGGLLSTSYSKEAQLELPGTTRIEDQALFEKANAVGMTVKAYKKYMELMEKRDAEDNVYAKTQNLKDITRRQTEEWKAKEKALRAEIKPDFENRPDIAADKFLREGMLYGEKIKGRPRLNSEKLTAEQKAVLPKDFHTPGGMHPDDVGNLFGYHSGEDMVNELAQMHQAREAAKLTPQRYINKLTDLEVERRMRTEHGDLAANILSEAQDHVISQTQFDMLHEETLALATKAGMEMSLTKEDMQSMARQGFAKMKVSQVGVETHLRDALRANELAERALLDGDPKEAFKQKQKQLFSFLYAREAKKLDKEQKKFNRLVKKYTDRQIASVPAEYTNYIHEIMGRFGIGVKRTAADLATETEAAGYGSLQEFVADKNGDFGNMALDDRLYDPNFKGQISNLTVDEFRGVSDAIIQLDKAARDEKKVLREGAKEDLATLRSGMIDQLETFPLKVYSEKKGMFHGLSDLAKQYMTVGIINAETWLNRWDRDNLHGLFNQWLVRPLSAAANREATLGREFGKMYREIGMLKDADRLVRSPFNDPMSITRSDDVGRPIAAFNRKSVAAMISNAGNPYNWDILTKGFNANAEATWQWLVRNSTKEDWVRAEKLGKVFERAFEEAQTVYRNVNGVAPPKIELQPFDIRFPNGDTFHSEGWYHPIIRDERKTNLVRQARGEDLLDKDKGLFPSIANGYTKRRTGKVDVLSLNHDMIVPRLNQILHDVAFRSEVIEAAKVVKDPALRKAIRQYYGEQYVPMLDNWLSDIAGASNIQTGLMQTITNASNYARTNVIGSLIGFNPGTVLKHGPTAAVNSMYEVGLRAFTRDFAGTAMPLLRDSVTHLFTGDEGSANRTLQFILNNSEEIRRRDRNWQETIGGAHKVVEGLPSLRDRVIMWGSKPVALSDMLSAMPTWLAAYKDEFAQTGDHGNAVFAGERAVRRAHGSTAITNLPELVRRSGPFGSWLTTLYGFFSTQMQRRAEIAFMTNDTYKLVKEGELKAAASNVPKLTALTFAAVIWPTIVEEYVTGIGTDDRRGWGTRAFMATLGGVASSFLYFRDFIHGAVTGQEPSIGMATTPAHDFSNAFKETLHPVKSMDRNHAAKTISDFMTVFGEATGLMPKQVAKVVRFGLGTKLGTEHPKSPADVAVGLMRGTSKRRIER